MFNFFFHLVALGHMKNISLIEIIKCQEKVEYNRHNLPKKNVCIYNRDYATVPFD